MSLFKHKQKTKSEVSPKVETKSTKKKSTSVPEITEDINAAISMSLYLYFNDRHDVESDIITIKRVKHDYSPWNSKIYGINNTL